MFAGIAAHGMLPLDRALTAGVGLDAGRDVSRRGLADSARRRAEHHRTRSCGTCNRSAARSSPDSRVTAHRRAAAGEGRPVRSLAEAAAADRRPQVPARVSPEARALSLRHGRVQSGLGARRRRFRGRPTAAAAPARCTSAARSTRSPRRSAARGRDASPIGRSCCSASRRCSIRRARRPASTWRGATATCPAASTVDMLDRIERQIERFAPGFRDCVLARSVMTPADIEAAQREPRRRRHRRRRHRPAAVLHAADVAELLDAGQGPLSLFGVHAAWRRRARHVRILRGQTCD